MGEKSKKLKENFAVHYKYDAFYTNGQLQYSNDGKQMFCMCGNQVKILNVENGTVLRTIQREEEELYCFTIAPDQTVLIVASRGELFHQWDLAENKYTRTWKSLHNGPVACMTFDSTSTLLATGGSDSTIKVWDIFRQYCTHNLKGAQGVISVVKFHPDIKKLLLFGAANDYALRVWDLRTSRCVQAMKGHFSTITCLQFTSDGNFLLSGGRDKVVILWDIQQFEMKKTIPVYEDLESIILLPEDRTFPSLGIEKPGVNYLTIGQKGLLRVWSTATSGVIYTAPEPVVSIPSNDANTLLALTHGEFLESLNVISLVTYERNILFYNIEDLTLKKQFIGYNDDVLDIQFMGEENSHIAVATNSVDIKVFDLSSFTCLVLKGHKDIVLALSVFKTNPLLLVSASKDNSIRVWHLTLPNKVDCIAIASGHTKDVGALATSLLGVEFIVSAGQDTTLKVWDLPDIKQLLEQDTGSECKLSTRFTEIAHEKDVNAIAVAPNDKIIASGSQDKTAKLWDSKTGALRGTFRGHRRGVWCVQFSPVDQVLATSSADTTIKIWSIVDFSCLKTFEGHDSSVLKFTFLSKGMQLLSSGSDGLLKLWNIKSNECVKTLDEHSDKVWALVASLKEDFVVTGGADSTIIVWKDVTEDERQAQWAQKEEVILQEQELSNLLQRKRYHKALALAINLEQPYRALTIIKEILKEADGQTKLYETIEKLRDDQIETLQKFLTTWNTNSKNCFEAQCVLNVILRTHMPQDLIKFTNSKEGIEGLLPYTERHVNRIDSLIQQAMILEYTWQCMKLSESTNT